ncbi:MAG: DHH family phosphoesterase [Candidatus Alkanophagales archaeon]
MRCLVIHHWDADGISSAALLYLLLRRGVFGEPPAKITNVTPKIGIYSLEGLRIREGNYDVVILADICFPREEVLRLKKLVGAEELWIFDHHFQEEVRGAGVRHVNPVIESGSPCPSTSWLLAERFRMSSPQCEFLKILGAVGDLEDRIKKMEAYRDVNKFLDSVNMSFEEFLHVVELVDSNYRVGCAECVEEAPLKLLEAEKPQDVLKIEEWCRRAEKVRSEVERCVSECGRRKYEVVTAGGHDVIICELDTHFHIISAVTRRLAAANPEKIVVVVNRGFECGRGRELKQERKPKQEREPGRGWEWERERERERGGFLQIYVRTHLGVDLTPLIPYMRGMGCSAGGKREVVGVVVPQGGVGAAALKSLEEFLTRNF